MAVLETKNLSRVIAGKALVDYVSVRVEAGEVVAVVGPSGSGKSSFLRLLNRLDEPTGGTVYLAGEDYRRIAPADLRRRVGMVMQAPNLFPGTVADNLRFGPRQRGKTISDAEIEALLDEVGLPGFSERTVLNLSGGEAQRVSLARTLANRPEVLLLDEPTSALDERSEREIESLLARVFREQRLTALMVTHDPAQAGRIATRAILVAGGRVARDGTVREVLDAQSADE